MPVYEREIVQQANAELLRQIEESLARSPARFRAGGFDSLTLSGVANPNPLPPLASRPAHSDF
jgi:hypothetical protein